MVLKMVSRTDPKGKVFTDVVRKTSKRAVVTTTTHAIQGDIYIRPEQRLRDDLNRVDDRFLAVTNASVYSLGEETLLHETPFLVVNKDHVVLVIPAADESNHRHE